MADAIPNAAEGDRAAGAVEAEAWHRVDTPDPAAAFPADKASRAWEGGAYQAEPCPGDSQGVGELPSAAFRVEEGTVLPADSRPAFPAAANTFREDKVAPAASAFPAEEVGACRVEPFREDKDLAGAAVLPAFPADRADRDKADAACLREAPPAQDEHLEEARPVHQADGERRAGPEPLRSQRREREPSPQASSQELVFLIRSPRCLP